LKTVRVAALGKSGSLTALLKTLGTLPPEERKDPRAADQRTEGSRQRRASPARREALKDAALEARLNTEKRRRHLAGAPRRRPRSAASIQSRKVTDELTAIFADMGFAVAEGPDIETNDYNFTKLNFSGRPSGARTCTTRSSSIRSRTARAYCCARIPRRCRCAPC